MSAGVLELQKYMQVSKYARYLEEDKRREVWAETTARYEGMMLDKYPHRAEVIKETCARIRPMDVLPSMRGLQYGGKPIVQHNARLYNCSGSYCDRLRFFPEAFYMLLCGSGVGTSVQERHIQHLPRFSKKRLAGVELPRKTFVIPDSIEGWADSAAVLVSSFHEEPIKGFEEYHDCEVEFDPSRVRRKGSKLSFGVGKAPGPEPLMLCLGNCYDLLKRALAEGLKKLNSIYAFDLFMHCADAGVSGGVRRSATIVLFDIWDDLMRMSKTGNWDKVNPQRRRANISAMCLRGEVAFSQFVELFEATKQWGEPGFYWSSHPDMLCNPCVEIGFWCKLLIDLMKPEERRLLDDYQGPVYSLNDTNGSKADGMDTQVALSGWQCCNLSIINGKTVKSEEDFYERCKLAARLGTWQAGFANFPYLGEVSDKIVQREALLGVSISGMMHHPDLLLNPDVQRKGAEIVVQTNEQEAALIGVNPAARATSVKPDGNCASTIGGFSGIHPGKFRKGIRHVIAGNNEAPYQHYRLHNPQACEPSVYSTDGRSDIIRFCLEYEGKLERDMTACEFLEYVKTTQMNWVAAGKTTDRCTQPWLSNNVSNTVMVRDHEWNDVARKIFANQEFFSGVALISESGDRDYAEAPFTSVYDLNEQAEMYGEASRSADKENLLRGSCVFANLWEACDLALGNWMDGHEPTLAQANWVHELTAFAGRFFGGELRKATYCLKDAFNWELYSQLKESYVSVDYHEMVEEDNGVAFASTVACAGGVCELAA